MSNSAYDDNPEIHKVLQWLKSSFEITKGKGSAAYFSIFSGWSKAYPETTGYLLPTLLKISNRIDDIELTNYINSSLCWLLGIQKEDGSFPQGITSEKSIVFDNAQILLGLTSCLGLHPNVLDQARKLNYWLHLQLDHRGVYKKNTFLDGYSPSYHSRCIWAQLNFEVKTNSFDDSKRHVFLSFLEHYFSLQNENGSFKYCGFSPHDSYAFTHTIIYTLRGLFETSIILKEKDLIAKIKFSSDQLLKHLSPTGRLPGRFNEHWLGDNNFTCNVGNAQFAILLFRLSKYYNQRNYQIQGERIVRGLKNKINGFPIKGIRNGLFSSTPIYGKYQPFKITNWTMKFALDALLESSEIKSNK